MPSGGIVKQHKRLVGMHSSRIFSALRDRSFSELVVTLSLPSSKPKVLQDVDAESLVWLYAVRPRECGEEVHSLVMGACYPAADGNDVAFRRCQGNRINPVRNESRRDRTDSVSTGPRTARPVEIFHASLEDSLWKIVQSSANPAVSWAKIAMHA